jgi:hypothetical protein
MPTAFHRLLSAYLPPPIPPGRWKPAWPLGGGHRQPTSKGWITKKGAAMVVIIDHHDTPASDLKFRKSMIGFQQAKSALRFCGNLKISARNMKSAGR